MDQPKIYLPAPSIEIPAVNHAFAVIIGPDVEDTVFLAKLLKRTMPYYSELGDRTAMFYGPAQHGAAWVAGAVGEEPPRGTKMVCSMCSHTYWTTARTDADLFYDHCNVVGCAGKLVVQ